MKKIMFIVYHDLKTEARSQEILELAQNLGETILITYSGPYNCKDDLKVIETGKGKRKYLSFIIKSLIEIRRNKPDIIILHDNYTAILINYIKRIFKNTKIIYDSSELYIDIKPKTFKAFIGGYLRLCEKRYLRRVDVVIAANKERAQIMKNYFNLNEMPIIFDNIHKIDDEYKLEECQKKYENIIKKDFFNILYAGGIAEKRMTYELASAVGELNKIEEKFNLIVLGEATENEKEKFKQFILDRNYNNIEYIGFIPRNEFKYLLQKSQISVSIFSQDRINNINCASGKLYESLFEGIPVLTSENPPLKRICNDEKIGVSTDDYQEGIKELYNNYSRYKENVKNYIKTINYYSRVQELTQQVKKKLNSKN